MTRPLTFKFDRHSGALSLEASIGDITVAAVEIARDPVRRERATLIADFEWSGWDKRYFLAVHRRVVTLIRSAHLDGIVRVEFPVDAGNDKGHRWARALGFNPEGLMACYANGRDYAMYGHVDRGAAGAGALHNVSKSAA